MTQVPSASFLRSFRVRDFLDFGNLYGMDYRFHDLPPGSLESDKAYGDTVVARGHIREVALSSGFRFTGSELEVLHAYSSASYGQAPLLIVIVLEGRVSLSVGAVRRELQPGQAVSLQLLPEFALEARQPAKQRLRTLTLAFDPASLLQGGPENAALKSLLRGVHKPVLPWRVPASLLTQLDRCLDLDLPDLQKHLVLEGLALQLVGLGLPESHDIGRTEPAGVSRERQRLEAVRQMLEFAPAEQYTLAGLAKHAAMSASSLRSKFRATYGISVFDYLRRSRLELGKRYIEQGYSIQQAAHRTGYRHATNFATAFRREFGVSPRELS